MNKNFKVLENKEYGYKYVEPLPSDEEIANFYKHKFYQNNKPDYLKNHNRQKEWLNCVYKQRFEKLEELNSGKGRILDIGSGPGYFLLYGKERGWETLGIEPSVDASEFSRNTLKLEVKNSMFTEDLIPELGVFDVVYLNNVIEHVKNPQNIMKSINKILKKEGLLIVCCPNDFNAFQEVAVSELKLDSWFVSPPEHLNYFSFDSLSNLFIKTGYSVVHKEGTFPMDLFLLMGDNYIDKPELGKECHKKRQSFEFNMINSGRGKLLTAFYEKLAEIGLGRGIVMVGRKK